MSLERIGSTLQESLKKLLRVAVVDEATVKELTRDLQRALLQADVNVQLVLDLSKRIEHISLHEQLPPGISRREHVVKVVYNELAKFLGEKPAKIPVESGKTNIIMLVGIQGSGKTTGSVKIAKFLKKRGIKSAIVCVDTYRPGAYAQIKQLAMVAGIPMYGVEDGKDPLKIAKDGVELFKKDTYEAIIVDTAGRHKDEIGLIEEMKNLAETVQPNQIILVVDGTIGQQVTVQAKAFNENTKLGSIYVAKLDGSARGGGALSAVAATGAPLTFIGTGEKTEDIELFDPPRFAGRLLGMGDIKGLIDKVKEAEIVVPEKKAEAILSGKFSLMDMYEQTENLKKMGPLGKIMKMIPGLSYEIPESKIQLTEDKMTGWKAILQSMTKEEQENPKILSSSRMRRIARGSGTNEKEVKGLIQHYEMTKKMMKTFRRGRGKTFGMLQKRMLKEMQP
ncbi:MAG: signal recognition particle protein Srp54 [Candidatus Bathyarchaeota archaeon]